MDNVKNIKKIDIHAHATAFPQYYPPLFKGDRYMSAPELIEEMDALGIGTSVLLPIVAAEGQHTPLTSEATKSIVDQYPDRFVWFCGVDPRARANTADYDLGLLLSWYKSLGAKGCGEITANLYADDPKMDNLFSHCEELDMPVTIHIAPVMGRSYGIVDELGLPRLEKMLKKHPNLKILGHSQPFWSEMSADITLETRGKYPKGKVTDGRVAQLMREYGNLYCDISAGSGANAFMRDSEYAAKFMEEFSDRILYGCDQCLKSNKESYPFKDFLEKMLDDGMLSPENYGKIVRYNAVKLLDLE